MKKAQEKPIKKESLLDAAYGLMMAKGYVATSADEICLKAGTTKGSFIHYSKSKEDLAKVQGSNKAVIGSLEHFRKYLQTLIKK